MSLIAWFRKYNKRIMAFVVIALMIVFTIGPAMDYLSWRRSGGSRVVAHYRDNQKITSPDLAWAQQQLELLKLLGANSFLRAQDPRYVPTQDLQTVLVGELLFAERAAAMETIERIRQIVNRGNYKISDEQINDIYAKEYSPNIYWLMLTKEARLAGMRIPESAAREQLKLIIPRIARGVTYEQAIGAIVRRQGVSEEQVLETFGDLMAVIEYSRMMCSIQDRTSQQNLHEADWSEQTIDTEYVMFDSGTFAEQARRPSEKKIEEQFEKYKGYIAGDVNEDNPYGFGYKWPARVELEYIAVRLDDVAATIARPTQQETEEYYQQHLSIFTRRVPSDPNDPNSPIKEETRSYAEVAGLISRGLYQQRIDSKAEQILLEAKSITEVNLGEIEGEQTKLTDEQIKSRAVDYEKTATELGEKYKLKVYAGKTGLLSASDIESDPNLEALYFGGTGYLNVSLSRLVFAVDDLKASELGPLDPRAPRFYENIGPFRDAYEATEGYSGKNMMLVRVIAAEKAHEPKDMDEKINRRSVRFDQKGETGKDTNSVREMVIDDLKRLAAMDKTAEKANQFVQMAAKDGWDAAIDKFNELYGGAIGKSDANTTTNKKKPFSLRTRTGLRIIPEEALTTFEIRREGDPMFRNIIDRIKVEGMLIEKLCTVLPDDTNALASPGTVVEFKPAMSYYCLKDLVIHLLYEGQYEKIKARIIINNAFADSQALAAVHYNPKNILKRMNFNLVKEEQAGTKKATGEEANAPLEPAGGEQTERQ